MKTKLLIIPLILGYISFSSCEKLELPNNFGNANNSETNKVTISTRSITEDIQYPLSVYAFDKDGKCACQQTINAENEDLSLSLSKGNYRIVAISNTTGYSLPNNPTLASTISMVESNNYAYSPLQMGHADINVGSTNQKVNITLAYKVATINFILENVPASVSSVNLNIAKQHEAINMEGEYVNSKNSTTELIKKGNRWVAENVYVFPGSNLSTVFTISLTDASGSTAYSYTYSSPLAAATPYNLSGTYSTDMISLSGLFFNEGWNSPIALNFNFGPGTEGSNTDSPTLPSEQVTSFPSSGSIWNGHFVAYVYSTDGTGMLLNNDEANAQNSVNLLLLSLNEWTDVGSSVNKTNPEQASTIVNEYVENGLSGWCIPTTFEAKYLKSLYTDEYIDNLNNTLTANQGVKITSLNDKGENNRYLCEYATYTFAWKSSSSVTKAGTATTYSLRLVNHITLTKE